MQITLTQKHFPFPYHYSDVWKKHKQISTVVEGISLPHNILQEHAYNNALNYILKHDEGGITHAIYNSNDVKMSIEEVRDLLFSMALIKTDGNKFTEYKKLFNDTQTVQECCQVYNILREAHLF